MNGGEPDDELQTGKQTAGAAVIKGSAVVADIMFKLLWLIQGPLKT